MTTYLVVVLLLNTPRIIQTFYLTRETDDPSSDLRKIAIDKKSGDIFAGGKNALMRMNSNFEKMFSISVGPRKNSKNCPPSEIHTCANATLTDNVVEVLEYFPAINQTIMCGSVQYGNCSLLYKNNIKPLPDREPANYLGSKYGSIIVPFQKTTGWVYFTGTSWDGRTLKQNTHNEFSFKRFDDSVFSRETAYSELRLCVRERQQSNLKFIYGFQDENFVYSIYLKIRKEGGTEHFETKISRICKLDDYMGTFQERILKCNQHNIATAAYYSAKEHLYVAFGTGRGSLEAGPSSVVCRFRDIKEQFDDDFKSCYTYLTSSGYTPPRWKNCNNDRKYMCKRNKNFTLDNFCTKDRHLDGIENLEHWNPHRVSLIQTDNSKLFTSVYAQNLTGHSSEILWVGTSDGLLLKADSNSPKVYGRFDLTKNRSIKIEADVETDQSGSYAYFLYGNKVSKFPLYSCQFHTTCGACVKSNDSLVCGWCKDACLQEGECATTWYNTSCPPFIHKLSPESGPVEGGTVLYLTGENFGKPNISSSSVSIGTSKCEEIEWNDTNICCNLTSSENGPFTSQIIVEIHPQKSINGYEIKGKSEVGVFNFSFKVPVVTSMSPSFGPRRGNTIVTITGNNLDIGSNTFLSMCQVIRKSSSNLVCKINECLLVQSGRVGMKYTKQCPYCDDVIMEIDKFKTVINGTFCYKQNPHIERISRTSTTTSGGLKFKIKGRQFDSVHNYVFRFVINTTHNEDMNCTQTNGTELVCETPDLTNMSIEHSRLQVVVLLENDDFYWKLWTKDKPFYIRVHQDPEIEGLKEILHDTHLLELQGRNLEGLQTEDIRVTLDDIECPMVDVTPTSLKCDLTTAIDKYHILERGLALRTKITIGNLAISFGHVTIQHQAKLNLTGNKTIVPVTLISVLIVLMLICVICMHRKRVGPFKRRILRHETVIFHADSSVPQMSRRLMPDPEPESSTSARLNDYVGDFDGKMEQAFGGLYNDFKDTVAVLEKQNLLIDGDSLRFDRNCSNLGRGNFGCVYKAFLQRPGDTFELVVAVKTIIRSTDADINAFLNEALIMKDFNHPNVLTLIGITLDKGEFPMVILPFMQNGSLLSFIRNEDNMPTVKLLVTYGLHIARGMEYMAENKFVHRDLAARNCMMDSDFIVKVADFGLTRDVYSKEYYSSENKQRLPVKWMAPESLEQGKYSAKSDVWSFGILLWELMTRGAIPYPEVDNWDVCTYIKTGRRLPRPEYCPPHLYRLMRMCWQEDLAQRPTFSRLREEIERLIDIKNNSKLAGDTQVELERCTHYHYMDEMSLARQRSLSTKWSVSSEDAALL